MLNSHLRIAAISILASLVATSLMAQTPLGSAITYQGRLNHSGGPVNGLTVMSFALFDAVTDGNQVGVTLTFDGIGGNPPPVSVSDGLFTVALDFGVYAFNGAALAAIGISSATTSAQWGVDSETRRGISREQHLTIRMQRSGAVSATGRLIRTTVAGGQNNTAYAPYATVGGGAEHLANGTYSTVGGGYSNAASGFASSVAGYDNSTTGSYSNIGGGRGNTSDGTDSTVGGGATNTASGIGCTIGGGQNNDAIGERCTVAGGLGNAANLLFSTVGGGELNVAGMSWTTVAGGFFNRASAGLSAIGGGSANTTHGTASTVPGGSLNSAGGRYSFAAGYRAKIRTSEEASNVNGDEGVFVWADSTNEDFQSTGSNQFLIRASGNVGINTNNPGVTLAIGDSGTGVHRPAAETLTLHTGSAERLRVTSTGTVGLNITNPAMSLQVAGPASHYGTAALGVSNSAGGDYVYLHSSLNPSLIWDSVGDLRFGAENSPGTDYVEHLRIGGDGNVGIGTSGPSTFRLTVNGSAAKPGGGAWSVFSDSRLKQNIAPMTGTLDKLLTLRGYSFEYLPDAIETRLAAPGPQLGLLADEVEQVFPDWVDCDVDGYRYVTERATTALMVEALRDLRAEKDRQLAERDARLEALERQNAELRLRLDRLESTR